MSWKWRRECYRKESWGKLPSAPPPFLFPYWYSDTMRVSTVKELLLILKWILEIELKWQCLYKKPNITFIFLFPLSYQPVLGSARTGLIFTRIQDGTHLGGLTQPGQTEQGIPYHVPSCWVPIRGKLGGGKAVTAQECMQVAAGGESGSVCSCCLCCVFSLSVSLLLFLFPLFAVLLNCPYPDPPVSACFFPFSSTLQREEGRPRGTFVAGHS